jgi:BMFP domain-containing protein YqiC
MERHEIEVVSAEVAALRAELDTLRVRVEHLESTKRDKRTLIPAAAQAPRAQVGGTGPAA